MRFIIECDGPVLDVQPCYWSAYCTACEELALPRTDPAGFWRAVRRGGDDAQLVRVARMAKLREFRRRFGELLESDHCLGSMQPQPEAAAALTNLRRSGECFLVTTGGNREVRQQLLDARGLSVHFSGMKALTSDRSRRVGQIRALAENGAAAVVAASSATLVMAAEEAGLFVVGISSGACTSARLTRAGARGTFADLAGLADGVAGGAQELVDAGLMLEARSAGTI